MAEKMKVLLCVTKSNWGGAQRYLFDLATHLPHHRFAVTVVAGGEGELPKRLRAANIPVSTLPHLKRDVKIVEEIRTFFALYRLYRNAEPSLVHLNSSKMGGLGGLAARVVNLTNRLHFRARHKRPKIKIIFTIHGLPFNEERNSLSRALIRFSTWFSVLLADCVVVIAEAEAAQLSHFLGTKRKIKLVKNGLSAPTFLPTVEARRELIRRAALRGSQINHLSRTGFWIGTIAELHPNKGLPYLLAAFDRAKRTADDQGGGTDIFLLLVGEGEERARLEQQIKKLGQEKNIFLVGAVPNAASYLQAFDLFVLPSVKEGLPYAVLEAGLARRAVIATRVGGLGEIINNGKSGLLVERKNVAALTQALTQLILDEKKRTTFGQALGETVEKNFSLERMIEETQKVYED